MGMLPFRRALLLPLLGLSLTLSASDWRFAGTSNEKGTVKVMFFDKSSVVRTDLGVRFWVESIPKRSLDRPAIPKASLQAAMERAAGFVARGYVPGLLKLEGVRSQFNSDEDFKLEVAGIVAYEEIAKEPLTRVSEKICVEINCKARMIHFVQWIRFNRKGDAVLDPLRSTQWQYIAPDSNAERWMEMLCASGN